MRALLWIVAITALATSLDTSLYGGYYSQSISHMISDIVFYIHTG